MMGKDVEEVSASLVREYLSRKGLKKTIACMDAELPRTNSSVNNRSDLRRILHLEGLYKQNKAEEHPFKSMLEIIVKVRMSEGDKTKIHHHGDNEAHPLEQTMSINTGVKREPDCMESLLCDSPRFSSQTPSEKTLKKSFAVHPESERSVYFLPSSHDLLTVSKEGFLSEKKILDSDSQKNRSSRIRRGIMAGPIASSLQESNKRRPARKVPSSLTATTEDCRESANWTNGLNTTNTNPPASLEGESSMLSNLHKGIIDHNGYKKMPEVKHRLKNLAPDPKLDGLHVLEMVLDDIENEESLCDVPRTSMPELSLVKTPMDQMTATALKEIIFGSPMACFTEEWKQQNFTFSDTPGLKYGIVQNKGGPCGVLAAVQACVLQKLLFEESSSDSLDERLEVSNVLRTKCLSRALADILWRAGNMKRATVAINTGRSLFIPIGRYKSDGILEMITYVTVETLDDLTLVLEKHVRQFESGPFGCILLTISAILCRTPATIQSDMDVPTSTLIGAHGYCTQELVNLLLCGRAVSNVFDDEMKLDSGNGNFTLLKGIKARCNIGLLSLFEHYNICKVGSHLKTPKFPIWVVCSESHFSVLFCPSEDLATDHCKEEEFDLYYYDGLANQQEPIRLTVYSESCATESAQSDNTDSDLIPPLELCIRTKWRNAVVSWNDTDPIL
ncbi:probable ubiquitin carboxyl-terminal hydrolase MINDY-4 [Pimephales promelas]|uniref:probable ubiquitin carboxyl-terminal hydrolase MINDY-4 n=1 Tax=Pimephales promelas TaxID=90988 RepID=UPI001955D698|nr:probable ubiquitin carboxyl-terminal hydrolase MINDY-4 [Pimephales promelas]KAG1973524.1 ubiquitin carboxyl-terminal hydrolase MINDY-3 [Pimephales promelas]